MKAAFLAFVLILTACDRNNVSNPGTSNADMPVVSPEMSREARIIAQRCYRTLDKQETKRCVERDLAAISPEVRETMMKLLPPLQ